MKKVIITILPIIFTAQACNFLFGDLGGGQGSGNRGVFLSVDSGQTWEEISKISKDKSLAQAQISRIVMESANPKNLIAVSANAGLFASDSGGAKWFQLLPDFIAYDAFFNPNNNQEIFTAGARNKLAVILKSPDRGGTWIQIYNQPVGQASVSALAFDPKNPAVFYAGLSSGTVLKSVDFGNTWNSQADIKDRIIRIIFSPDGRALYLLARTEGLHRSVDGGKTWTKFTTPEFQGQYSDFILDPSDSRTIALATSKGFYRSQDAGATWLKVELPAAPELNNVSTIAINPKDSKQIFAAIRSTIYRSDDRGVTWRPRSFPTNRVISHIVIDPQEPNRIYAGLK